MPMLQYSDEERERFATFASLLLICRDVLRQVMEQTQMQPSDGSRCRRALIDELSGAREARKQTKSLVGEDSDDYRQRQATLEDFEAAAISMFSEPIRVKQQYRLGGQEYPGHRDLIVEASRVAKVGLPDRVIRGTYALMSNSVHPTPHSIRELFHVEQHGSETTATLARPADFHENLTKIQCRV